MLKRLFLFAVALPLLGAEFLPLQPGNSWTYRQTSGVGSDTFTITVGSPVLIQGNTYYALNGYVGQQVLVRYDFGNLYYRDEEADRDVLLTAFEVGDFFFNAPLRQCEQSGQADAKEDVYSGPAARINTALTIRYHVFNCADAGVLEERYAANIGMLRRVVQTFAGPRAYELAGAQVGGITVSERPNTSFSVSATVAKPQLVLATLRLTVNGAAPVKLVFPSSQEYDAALRNQRGETLAFWSRDKVFAAVQTERTVGGELVYRVELPLDRPLEPGSYTLEGWLTSGAGQREFSAATTFEIPDANAAPGTEATAVWVPRGAASRGSAQRGISFDRGRR